MTPRAMQTDRYLGRWPLVPELSIYEMGDPPRSGTYTLAWDGDGISASVEWEAVDGSAHETGFAGRCDGSRQALAQPGVTFSITRVDARTLDSVAFREDEVIAYARRVVSDDRALLAVVQQGTRLNGSTYRNFQVYRRLV